MRAETILAIDDNNRFLESLQRQLEYADFRKVYLAIDAGTARALFDAYKPEILIVDIHLGDNGDDGLNFLSAVKSAGYQGTSVVVSADKSSQQFFRAARAGADDFLVKSPHVNFASEIVRLLEGLRGASPKRLRSNIVSELGYLRSFRLTPKEIEVLREYTEGFPRLGELADRIDQAPVQLRKVFSRIYTKLGVNNLAQLAHILTVCEMFAIDN